LKKNKKPQICARLAQVYLIKLFHQQLARGKFHFFNDMNQEDINK